MGNEISRIDGVRRSWRARFGTAIVAVANTIWGGFNTLVSTANLPSDTNDALEALVSVPELVPFGVVAVSVGLLVWSFSPAKRQVPISAPEQVAPPLESEEDRIYRIKRAELEAEDRIRRERATERIFGFDMGAAFADALVEQEADRKAEAEARRQRMIREASAPLPPPPPPPKPVYDMPFHQVVKHVALKSMWAGSFVPNSSPDYIVRGKNEPWDYLRTEICRPLIAETLSAVGVWEANTRLRENGHSSIVSDFWRTAQFKVDHLLASSEIGYARGSGGIYHDIRFDRLAVNESWPVRTDEEISTSPSPFQAALDIIDQKGLSYDVWWEYYEAKGRRDDG